MSNNYIYLRKFCKKKVSCHISDDSIHNLPTSAFFFFQTAHKLIELEKKIICVHISEKLHSKLPISVALLRFFPHPAPSAQHGGMRGGFPPRLICQAINSAMQVRLNEINAHRLTSASSSGIAHHALSLCENCKRSYPRKHKSTSTASLSRGEKGRGKKINFLSCDKSGDGDFQTVKINAAGRCSRHQKGG